MESPVETEESSDQNVKPNDEHSQLKDDEDLNCTSGVNKDLIVPKLSFFFFYMAIGAFLPYLGVYYKQLWLNARESGILLGIRPFIKMLCSPAWGVVTDYFHKPKLILLLSLLGSMVAHWSQSIVSPFVLPCYVKNKTHAPVEVVPIISSRDIRWMDDVEQVRREYPQLNFSDEHFHKLVKTLALSSVRKRQEKLRKKDSGEIQKDQPEFTFPAAGRETDLSQKDFSELLEGDLGPSLKGGSFGEHQARDLDRESEGQGKINNEYEVQSHLRSPSFARTIMIKNKKVKSPKPESDFRIHDNKKIYLTLLILIIFGEMVAAPAPMLTDSGTLTLLSGREHEYGKQRLFGSFGWGAGALLAGAIVTAFHSCPYSDNINYVPVFYVFAVAMFVAFIVTFFFKFTSSNEDHEESKIKSCIQGLMLFKNVKNAAFIFVLFFCGFLHSLKLSFLFWYLQDIGGTPILFTLIVLINSLSEVFMFYIATYVVRKLGHDAVLYIGLWCYGVKYLLYSYIQHPWYVLPVETLQGVTYGLVWTASVSYVTSGP
ncbi:hypothetical protein QZH41_015854, partial [Actinostola sp. cb2023]